MSNKREIGYFLLVVVVLFASAPLAMFLTNYPIMVWFTLIGFIIMSVNEIGRNYGE